VHGVRRRWTPLIGAACLALTGCGRTVVDSTPPPSESCAGGAPVFDRGLNVTVSLPPLANIVGNIAGTTGTAVVAVLPESVDAHDFRPAPNLRDGLVDTDVVFLNGLGLEGSIRAAALDVLLADAEVCELADAVVPESERLYHDTYPAAGGSVDPHVWLVPRWGLAMASRVRDVLSARDPQNAAGYAANYDLFAARVEAFDVALRASLATVPADRRTLLTYHDSFAYFAAEYGWDVAGAMQDPDLGEPDGARIAELADLAERSGVVAVFGSEVFRNDVARRVGALAGVPGDGVLYDDDLLGGEGDLEHTWLGTLRWNYVTIVEALGGDAAALRGADVTNVVDDPTAYTAPLRRG
jgi:ABC-type Zn uptake system ZnuABC Zn-binding protein ZnuA